MVMDLCGGTAGRWGAGQDRAKACSCLRLEPVATAPAGVAPFMKALSWSSAHLPHSILRGKP